MLVNTRVHGTIDISDDLTGARITLTENAISGVSFTLLNRRRKYDGVFTPNDRISIMLKRIRPLQVFAGYLNTTPLFSALERTISLSASCSLKRLQYTPWDPGAPESAALLQINSMDIDPRFLDGGIAFNIINLLSKVANWDPAKVHIGALPSGWLDRMKGLADAMDPILTFSRPQNSTPISGAAGNGSFAKAVFSQIGAPASQQNLVAFSAWAQAEGGTAAWNPLNCTEINVPGHSRNDYNAVPVQNYESFSIGVAATAKTLTNGLHNGPLAALKAGNSAMAVAEAVTADGNWGTSGLIIEIIQKGWSSTTTRCDTPETSIPAGGSDWLGAIGKAIGNLAGSVGGTVSAGTAGPTSQGLLDLAISKIGTPYSNATGTPGNVSGGVFANPNPVTFDCSGFVQWLCWKLNVPIPGGVGSFINGDQQFRIGQAAGLEIPIEKARTTPGALLVILGVHTGLSMGDGKNTIDANGSGGVNIHPWDFNGQPWDHAALIPGLTYSGYTPGTGLLNNSGTNPVSSDLSTLLRGFRALLNDEALFDTVAPLVAASQRSFMAAPNGDFISWFPDYFDEFGVLGKMDIADVELQQDFSVAWDDQALKTHVFAVGASAPNNQSIIPGGNIDAQALAQTAGVASVEFQPILDLLINNGGDMDGVFKDAGTIFDRFGARPFRQDIPNAVAPESQFFFALYWFRKIWAQQFSTTVALTFMPEVYPGMIVRLPGYKIQLYVNQVTHNISFDEGQGFTTEINVMAPSSLGGGFYGLPRGGHA